MARWAFAVSLLCLSFACRASEPPELRPHAPKPTRAPALRVANAESVAASGADHVAAAPPTGYGLSGAGVLVGSWDDGVARLTHGDLAGRVTPRDRAGYSEHATHTAATLLGSGEGSPTARGFAPAARLWGHDFHHHLAEAESESAALHLSSHPYGLSMGWLRQDACPERLSWHGGTAREDPAFGAYTELAAELDGLLYRTGLPMFWAAGNERSDVGVARGTPHFHVGSCTELYRDGHLAEGTLQFGLVGGHAVAKNAITVGAARDAPPGAQGVRLVALQSSGTGPTDDGRIKPEIAMNAERVRSASAAADHAYGRLSGTSSATAAAAGAAALLAEHSRRVRGLDLDAADLRGLLVHTAREAGRAPGPDYRLGYGLVDVAAAAALLDADAQRSRGLHLLHGAVADAPVTFTLSDEVARGTPLRFTLAWIDPPAPVDHAAQSEDGEAAPSLVNDLDLVVTAPDGETRFYPYRLDPTQPLHAATHTSENRRDNLEVVDVRAADNRWNGGFRVDVAARGALFRGRPQAFSLIASHPLDAPDTPLLRAPRQVEIAYELGTAPPPARVPIAAQGAPMPFVAHSTSTAVAVEPQQGTTGDSLTITLDPAAFPQPGEYIARVIVDSEDPRGSHLLGVLIRVRCEPDCETRGCGPDPRCGQTCGSCAAGESCDDDGRCQPFSTGCPAATLEGLGPALVEGDLFAGSSERQGSCGGERGRELAFAWRAPRAGRYVFSTRGSEVDTVLYLRDGNCEGPELACADDSADATSALSALLAQDQRVVIFVDAHDDAEATAGAPFRLGVLSEGCPEIDLGSRLSQGLVTTSTLGGVDDGTGDCGGEGSEDVGFRWTAPADGSYRFALFQPRYQAVLYVRADSCVGDELGCTPAPDVGPIDLSLLSGQEVVVSVDGRDGSSGDFSLDIQSLAQSCQARCDVGGGSPEDADCFCDAECVALGDCCVDACEQCGRCRCERDCAGLRCGDDGCGGSCGECEAEERCDEGRCTPDPCAGVDCEPCSVCQEGRCRRLPEGAPCEDGDACTVLDACRDGECQGQARDCDDGIPCTEDRCRAGGRCESTPTAACDRCDAGSDCPLRLGDAAVSGRTASVKRAAASGCGCRIARRAHPSGSLVLLTAVALWLGSRRRKCRPHGRDHA